MEDANVSSDIVKSVGRLEGQVGLLTTSVGVLHDDLRDLRSDMSAQHGELRGEVTAIRAAVSEDRGRWKVLAGVSGLAATIAGGVVAIAQFLLTGSAL